MAESDENFPLEIGHVLFIDIVGYSKLLINEQKTRLRRLTAIVLATPQVASATGEQLVRLPTGDGMALVFRRNSEEPARCALEIAAALKQNPEIEVRMGVHSGPVSEVIDVSGRTNLAGPDINVAQRVMDCGDAGHILVSKHLAEDLGQYSRWHSRLHDLGECEVKHGVSMGIVNLLHDGLGNPQLPTKLRDLRRWRFRRGLLGLAVVIGFLALGLAFLFLRQPAPVIGAVSDHSVAVIPLVNTSGEPKNEYFSDGLSEELIAVLAKIPDLKVIGRGSSFAFKGKPDDSASIGQKLGVAQLVEGSVRRDGERVRIVAGLIRARDGQELWSETYDRDLKDIFAVQSEIAQAVAAQLKLKLLGTTTTATPASSQHLAAYDALLQAKFHYRKGSGPECRQAIKYAEEATSLDPNYAAAWAWLSSGWRRWAVSYETGDIAPAYAKARTFADKALGLDPDSVDALVALWAISLSGDFDYQRAEGYARRALERAPGDVAAKSALSSTYLAQGKLDEAERVGREVLALDPLQNNSWHQLGLILLARERRQEAEQCFRKVLELQPQASRAHSALVSLAILQHNPKRALQEAESESEGFWRDYAVALAFQAGEDRDKADATLQQVIDKYSRVGAYQIAGLYAVRRQPDAVFLWLDKAYENRDGGLSQLLSEPFIANYRDDPRFAAFCRKLKLELPPKP